MKLGEIKLEALKLMWANYGEDIGIEQLDDLMDSDTYGSYLIAMTGSINRCFADLETRKILPMASIALPAPSVEQRGQTVAYDMRALIGEYLSLERLVYESGGQTYEDADIADRMIGDLLCVPYFDTEREGYRVIYRPCLSRIYPYTDNETELPIPDRIAAFIPYWIKSELYREEEPNEAGEARNWYEAHVSAVLSDSIRPCSGVRSVYAIAEV